MLVSERWLVRSLGDWEVNVANTPELQLLLDQLMSAAPILPELAALTEHLGAQLRDEAERCRRQSDELRADAEPLSRPSRRAVEDSVAAGFRAGKAAALADEAERWAALAYALRHGWTAVDAQASSGDWAIVDEHSN
jgi:hypothetical protein